MGGGDFHEWEPLGQPLDGEFSYPGQSLALSADGHVLAAGAATGHVQVYQYSSIADQWVEKGKALTSGDNEANTQSNAGWFGYAVALSGDGTVLVTSAPRANDKDGVVFVYQFNQTNNIWELQGDPIVNTATLDLGFGHSLALSSDGTRMAVGAPCYLLDENLLEVRPTRLRRQ